MLFSNLIKVLFNKRPNFKKLYFFIFISLFILGFIFLIGLIAFIQTSENQTNKLTKNQTPFYSPNEIDYIFQVIDRENANIQNQVNYYLSLAGLKLSNRRLEEEVNLISYLLPLINNVEVDPNKSEMTYAYEISNILNKTNTINININDKQSFYPNGLLLSSLAEELVKIKPPSNYLNFHKGEIVIIGGLGYILKELSTTNDNERAVSLTQIMNNLIESQKKIAENFK